MRLIFDNAAKRAALNTLRELIAAGLAGNDCYDPELFVIDAPKEQRDLGDVACDILGCEGYRDGAFGHPRQHFLCRLPYWVRVELGLNEKDAPQIVVPLASRGVDDDVAVELGIDENGRNVLGALAVVTEHVLNDMPASRPVLYSVPQEPDAARWTLESAIDGLLERGVIREVSS
jgi:hypothetical protein